MTERVPLHVLSCPSVWHVLIGVRVWVISATTGGGSLVAEDCPKHHFWPCSCTCINHHIALLHTRTLPTPPPPQARQLSLLAPVLPVKDPLLPSQAYDLVLQVRLGKLMRGAEP